MESQGEPQLGICYECSTKNGDSSQKQVYHCDICSKWFCELHIEPKFPYFVDWETMFDIQGNPEVKALFFSEHGRQDGHPDFSYLRIRVEELKIEENQRNWLIQQAIDGMVKANKGRKSKRWEEEAKQQARNQVITRGNKYGYKFFVPKEVYSNAEYREYLNFAKTVKSVNAIVAEYYRRYGRRQEWKEPIKKKHWWNKS